MSSFDPEAEQEVDFGRYWRLLGSRWWLLAAGLVVGAVIGYAISLGGGPTQTVSCNISKNGQTPLLTICVEATKRRIAGCAANAGAKLVIEKTSRFANLKIANFRGQISYTER